MNAPVFVSFHGTGVFLVTDVTAEVTGDIFNIASFCGIMSTTEEVRAAPRKGSDVMKKGEKIVLYTGAGGIAVYIVRFIADAVMNRFRAPLPDYFGQCYMSIWGALLLICVLAQIGVLISVLLRRRRNSGKKEISRGYTVSFFCSFIPFLLLLAYSAYCMKAGFPFLWSVSYGWEAFEDAFMIMGFVFVIIPVFPFCLFWQAFYIVRRIKARKRLKAERS